MHDERERLTRLRSQIEEGNVGTAQDWGGADVVIGPPPRPTPTQEGFYPDPDYVATRHHRELSWLFEQLRNLFQPHLDFINKIEFYGRLADAATWFIEEEGDEDSPVALLVEVVDLALLMTSRIEVEPGLDQLTAQISQGVIKKSPDWGGAGVVIGPPPRPTPTQEGFYPDPDYVATRHHRELSWLFEQLRDLFQPHLDFINKFEFYGRLADAANRYVVKYNDEKTAEDLLLAVIHEAYSILSEFSLRGELSEPISRKIGADPLEELMGGDPVSKTDAQRLFRDLGLDP